MAASAYPSSASASDSSPVALKAARQLVAQPGMSPPPRAAQRAALVRSTAAEPLDVLVVGGGATGWATSSRSTKLIHGARDDIGRHKAFLFSPLKGTRCYTIGLDEGATNPNIPLARVLVDQVTKPNGSSLDMVVQSIVSQMMLNPKGQRSAAGPADATLVSGKKMKKIGMFSSSK